jgi:hypothetical protein
VAAAVASVPEGAKLRGLAKKLGWATNPGFSSLVSVPQGGPKTVEFGSLKLTVIGPRADRVKALKTEWAKVMRAKPTAAKVLELTDRAVANLSSIIVVARVGKRSMLLTGDARADDVEDGLQKAGLLNRSPARFDLVKVAHHGSIRSASTSFFEHVLGDHYVISADGRDGNPDTPTLRLLTDARGPDKYTIHMTNKTGKDGLGPRLAKFFKDDKKNNNRNYTVVFRNATRRSIFVHLGGDTFEY